VANATSAFEEATGTPTSGASGKAAADGGDGARGGVVGGGGLTRGAPTSGASGKAAAAGGQSAKGGVVVGGGLTREASGKAAAAGGDGARGSVVVGGADDDDDENAKEEEGEASPPMGEVNPRLTRGAAWWERNAHSRRSAHPPLLDPFPEDDGSRVRLGLGLTRDR